MINKKNAQLQVEAWSSCKNSGVSCLQCVYDQTRWAAFLDQQR